MEFKFTPKSEDKIKAEEKARIEQFLWPVGQYPFEITSAFAGLSKEKYNPDGSYKSGGHPMIELKVNLFKDDGKVQSVFDYLSAHFMEHKLRHAAYACGLGADYETGKIVPSDLVGKTGLAKIKIQPAKDGYAAKNVIEDYVLDEASSVGASAAKTEKAQASGEFELNDSIPF